MTTDTAPDPITLSPVEAACLQALRSQSGSKTAVAVAVRLPLKQAEAALQSLRKAGLTERVVRQEWRVTERGRCCTIRQHTAPARRHDYGRVLKGSTAARLLALLDRPRRGSELAEHVGVSRQRVHQLVVRLHAFGHIRLGDERDILLVVARPDDPTVLLPRDQERVLSALPEDAATTAGRLAQATGLRTAAVRDALASLVRTGLADTGNEHKGTDLYRLTTDGARHVQRRAVSGREASPAPLPVRSDRVYSVLSFIAAQEPVRTTRVRDSLGIAPQSASALMQYLKRKGLVEKSGEGRVAPYRLTRAGHDTLRDLARRRRP